jgi:ribonucrease Y
MVWVGLEGGLAAALLVALLIVLVRRVPRRARPPHPSPTGSHESSGWLEPLATTATDAVHSEAASLLHLPEDPATVDPVAADAVNHALAALRAREEEFAVLRLELHNQHADLERREHRLGQREERFEEASRLLDERAAELTRLDEELSAERVALLDIAAERRAILERLARLSAEEAKAELIADIERDAKREAALTAREIERTALVEADSRARNIVATAIQRLAAEQTAESVVSVVRLPGDDMKGRIIGREGRNIRSFEQTTGVNLIIDETPEAVVLSCFDPVRREVGRLTLQELVADGRIHPSRIEEVYRRSLAEIDRLCQRAGEDAVMEIGVTDVHPHLVFTLGQLRYRTSYGQSVLKHLVESAHAAGLLAAELGIDGTVVKRAALLHDIGKALTHEAEGSHALVGAELAHRYGEHADIVHAIEAHHNEVEPRTIEAVLTQAADAISGGRPGARRESPEAYVKRLERLEEIAMACEGVEKVFAMQAGREVRVMVLPEVVDDIGAQVLARDIVKQIEHELTYPGQIKVTVIRESRTTEIAR